ncbi:MAG: transcription antitermination factor NusB [Bacteroidetes bacterium HGW-Bacteroidetes-6]|jgi:N utilization substance protein B|nr:MAG: transcription antitermination factor NusB [Bacteroidetes bacterium HGW-Bacteroidetes-6]
MLSRHIIRSKTLQAIYSYSLSGETDLARGRSRLIDSVEDMADLVHYQLSALLELRDIAEQKTEENRHKLVPTEGDLNPNVRFIENPLLGHLRNNEVITNQIKAQHINWAEFADFFRRIFQSVTQWNEYILYGQNNDADFNTHRKFVAKLFKKFIAFDGNLKLFYEEKNIHWGEDSQLTGLMIHAWLKSYDPNNPETLIFPQLLKQSEHIGDDDDRKYMITLFDKTILHFDEYDALIKKHIQNWDMDRIITIDSLILKMAMAEITEFENIPIKASMNEYIELSKEFGTPKSNSFVNGLLDKLIKELKDQGKVVKSGRGLA